MEQTADKQLHQVQFSGTTREYFGIWIVNILLTILTLGIYSAWAKVRSKKYLYGNTTIDGDPFQYLATPKQILIGRLIAVVILALYLLVYLFSQSAAAVFFVLIFVMSPILLVRNLRFNYRMTRYRNVRFRFTGSYKNAFITFLGRYLLAFAIVVFAGTMVELTTNTAYSLAVIIVLLISGPWLIGWYKAGIYRFIGNNLNYGNLHFQSRIENSKFALICYKTFLMWITSLVVLAGILGIILFALLALANEIGSWLGVFDADTAAEQLDRIYSLANFFSKSYYLLAAFCIFYAIWITAYCYFKVHTRNYYFNQTSLDENIELGSKLSFFSYLGVVISNSIVVLLSFGLAYPWAIIRYQRMLAAATTVTGDLTLAGAKNQQATQEGAVGEEITDAFDMGLDIP